MQVGHEQMRQHAGEPRPRPQKHRVGGQHRLDGVRTRQRRLLRTPGVVQADAPHTPRSAGDGDLSPDAADLAVLQPGDLGLDLKRLRRHRQHAAGDAQQRGGLVQSGHRVTQHLEQPRQQQVAHGVPGERTGPAETVLEHLGPQRAAVLGRGQGGQRLPEITRWQQPQLLTQPPRRSPVVGDGHHRRDVRGDPPQRAQGRVQPVAPTERDGTHPSHSLPRSRCTTLTAMPSSSDRRAASSSEIATLRCLPPVQPTARVR